MSPEADPLTALPARLRPDRFTLLMIAIAALGVVLVLGRVTFGVVLISDSAWHISAARSLLAGEELVGAHGFLYSSWPPLYPLLLAAASLGTFDPIDVAGPLNAIVFGLTVFVVGRYLRDRLESRFLAAWGCLATALAVPLTELSSQAMSEILFILLMTLALIRTDQFLVDGRFRTLVWAAVFSALAWQTRYMGGAVPVFVGLLLLFHPRAGASVARRVRRVTAYLLITAAPMVLWLLRNHLATGAFTRHSSPREDYPLPMILRDVFDILWGWAQTHPAVWLVPLACILVVAPFVAQRRRLTVAVADWRPFWLFGGFALTYFVLLIAAMALLVDIFSLFRRYLIPLYIPIMIAGVFVLDRVLDHEREKRLPGSIGSLPIIRTMMPGKKGSVLAVIVMIALSLGVASQTVPNVSRIVKASRGELDLRFNEPRWAGSETIRYIQENLVAGMTHSNAVLPMALHVGRNRQMRRHYRLWKRLELPEEEVERTPDGANANYVVWFDESDQSRHDYDDADLRLLPGLELVAELEDGVVFKVNRDGVPRSNP